MYTYSRLTEASGMLLLTFYKEEKGELEIGNERRTNKESRKICDERTGKEPSA